MELTHGSLFAGIGGFDLGFERAGFKAIWQVEIDPYCQAVLAAHFPTAKRFSNVRDVGAHNLVRVDLISGGFPCQPFSVAGKRRGTADDRYLWPEMRRVIDEVRPRWVVAENVPGLIKLALDQVLSDLEALGYTVGAVTVPACAVDAPHRRERLWIVAHAKSIGSREETDNRSIDGASADVADTARHEQGRSQQRAERQRAGERRQSVAVADTAQQLLDRHGHTRTAGRQESPDGGGDDANTNGQSARRSTKSRTEHGAWLPEPNVGRVAHGVPHRVDRLKALGNAVVPQIAEEIGRMIMLVEEHHRL